MSKKKYSPRRFRSRGIAAVCFVLIILVIGAVVWYGFEFIKTFDFTDTIPEDAKLRAKFSSAGYIPATPEPTPPPEPTPTPLPTPKPSPTGTPIPLEMYSAQKMNFVMPADAKAPGEASIQYMSVSPGDNDQSVILGGWAYIYDFDAEDSTIYLVVSSKSGSVHRFYETVKQPGFAGVIHPGPGSNLERADFRAAFSVKSYEEGAYKLGALVEQPAATRKGAKTYGYFEFGLEYQIYVKGSKVTQVG